MRKGLSLDCRKDIYEKVIVPRLAYGRQVWIGEATETDLKQINKVQGAWAKIALKLPKNTDHMLASSLLGKCPLDLELKFRQATKELTETGMTKVRGYKDFWCRRVDKMGEVKKRD